MYTVLAHKNNEVPMEENLTRQTLIQKLQDDCENSSWEEFIKLYRGYVFVVIRKMNFNDEDCQDIMQATFLKVWKNVQRFKHGGKNGQFRRWLTLIAKNTALNCINKRKKEYGQQASPDLENQESYLNGISQPEIDQIADSEWEIYVTNIAWNNIKDNINQTQKTIFQMLLEGKSRSEIGVALELPANTVSVYKRRITDLLQREIKRLEIEFG